MPLKHSSLLLAVLLTSLLAACSKTDTSTPNTIDDQTTPVDGAASLSSPQPQNMIKQNHIANQAPKESKHNIAAQTTERNAIPVKSAATNVAPVVVQPFADTVINSAEASPPPQQQKSPNLPDTNPTTIPANNTDVKIIPKVAQKPATTIADSTKTSPAPQQEEPPALPVQSTEPSKPIASSDNAAPGKAKSELCQGCHGENGISLEPLIPHLAGQFNKYISKQIRDYQTKQRTHQIMNAMAKTVSDDDLADIADYFASQTTMKGEGTGDPTGENIFLNGNSSSTLIACIKCHGEKGKGINTSLFPVIGGQHKEYLRKQLMDFRGKIRTNSPGGIMNTIAKSLTDAEIESLAEYISSQ